MTQENKELLLKDLCCRLPYGVKCHYKYYDFVGGMKQLTSEDDAIITGVNTTLGNPIQVDGYYVEVEYVKPYLRPMSSMTEEERKHWRDISLSRPDWDFTARCLDWLNSRHFDYRGLIERGLALEAPKDMYNIK